jgi:hypothetical protein
MKTPGAMESKPSSAGAFAMQENAHQVGLSVHAKLCENGPQLVAHRVSA